MELEKYDLKELIGAGTYGQVYKAREKATGRNVAVKLIQKKPNPTNQERKKQKKFLKECSIHSSLTHPNIIQMISSFETIEYIVVVTELAGLDLHRFMSLYKLNEELVKKLTCHILSALYYLHSHRVSHRDLKPQNILLNNHDNINEIEAKICDFGLARKWTSETYLLTSVKGTPLYMAPEVLNEALYDERADLWSVGCIIYEAHFGKPPIKAESFSQLVNWWKNPQIVWPSSICEVLKSFLQGLLRKEAKMRFTWPQIIEHPYMKDNLMILDDNRSERPLTEDLTTSQQIRKEKQRDEIKFFRDKKMIADAMTKCQQAHFKINHRPHELERKPSNVIGDNESISSDDSVNAIIQTDLETDVEGPLIKKESKQAGAKIPTEHGPITQNGENQNQNQNLVIVRYKENFDVAGDRGNKDNANLKIGTMLENMEKMQLEDENKRCTATAKPSPNSQHTSQPFDGETDRNVNNSNPEQTTSNYQLKNTDSVKRKLSNNLNNFSIRLGNDLTNSDKTFDEFDKDSSKEKPPCTDMSQKKQDTSDSQQDAYEDDQGPAIDDEEYLACIRKAMRLTLEMKSDGKDDIKDQNVVGFIVAILRKLNVGSKVIGSIVQLLSIPFVLPLPPDDITQIKAVYIQTKLLPNLMFASKIICMVKGSKTSFSSTLSSSNFAAGDTNQEQDVFRKMSDLSVDELKTLTSIYELVCYLLHLNDDFLSQFCDSLYIMANDLLSHFLSDVVYDSQGMQLLCAIVSILSYVLRETPENAKIVEPIIFHESVDIKTLLLDGNIILKTRLCNLLRILGRFCCFSLQKTWTREFRQTLESLLDGGNGKVKDAAQSAIEELGKLSFYNV